MSKKLILSILILIVSTYLPSVVYAEVSINPYSSYNKEYGNFMQSVKPGQEVSYQVKLFNMSQKSVSTATLYGADVITNKNGGMSFKYPDVQQTSVGSWFESKPKTITLQPGASQVVTMKLKVPEDIKPGQYIGGIVAINKGQSVLAKSSSGSINLPANTEYYVQVVLDYDSSKAEKSYSIRSFKEDHSDSGMSIFSASIDNTGTILIKPKVSIKIVDTSGKVLFKEEKITGSIYPNTSTEVTFDYGNILRSGSYTSIISTSPGENISHSVNKTFGFSISSREVKQSVDQAKSSHLIANPESVSTQFFNKYKWEIIGVASFIILLIVATIIILLKLLKSKSLKS